MRVQVTMTTGDRTENLPSNGYRRRLLMGARSRLGGTTIRARLINDVGHQIDCVVIIFILVPIHPLAYEYTCVPVYVSYGIEVQDATRTRGGWIEISGGSLYYSIVTLANVLPTRS